MMEYVQLAAFGWATLTWWSWPLLFLVVLAAVYVAVRLGFREDDDTVRPCLAHLGTEADGLEWWCMLKHGHDGTHLNQWGVDPSEDLDETWDDEELSARYQFGDQGQH